MLSIDDIIKYNRQKDFGPIGRWMSDEKLKQFDSQTFRQLTMYLKSVILFFILSGRHGKAQVLAASLKMLFMIMKVLIMLLIMLMVIYIL